MPSPNRNRWLVPLFAVSIALAAAIETTTPQAQGTSQAGDAPTFTRDVAPILYANCVECHRAGEIAPMSLITYDEARPWARAIKAAVTSRQMPPWFADPGVGHFANERRLVDREIATLNAWADAGAPAGNEADATVETGGGLHFYFSWLGVERDQVGSDSARRVASRRNSWMGSSAWAGAMAGSVRSRATPPCWRSVAA